MVESRQRVLDKRAEEAMDVKSRRGNFNKETPKDNLNVKSILQIPQALFASFSPKQKKAFLRWKNATINGEQIGNNEIVKILKQESSDPNANKKRKKAKKSRAMKIQHTMDQNGDATLKDVRLSMKSDEDVYTSDSSSLHEEVEQKSSKGKRKKGQNVKTNKIVRANRPEITRGEGDMCYNTILDSGTEWNVVGGPAWEVQKTYSKSLNMSAVDDSMQGVNMHCCDAVTAVKNTKG